jgi:hypothetical protein
MKKDFIGFEPIKISTLSGEKVEASEEGDWLKFYINRLELYDGILIDK